jgi:cation diffusion facilitator CzcD-associated flavoprotein CzcO
VIELPQGSNIKSKFQYFTKKNFKEVNPMILQFLEFREKTFLIKNFDIMNFTKTVMNIQIDENFTIFQPKNKVPSFLIQISGFRGVAENIKYKLTKIPERKSKVLKLKEI